MYVCVLRFCANHYREEVANRGPAVILRVRLGRVEVLDAQQATPLGEDVGQERRGAQGGRPGVQHPQALETASSRKRELVVWV